MKKLITILALFLVTSTFGLTISWPPNDPVEQITNYRVYWAIGTGQFQLLADTGTATSYTIPNIQPGVYRFRVTAKNLWEESAPSGVVASPPPPNTPRLPTTYVIVGSRTSAIVNLGQ